MDFNCTLNKFDDFLFPNGLILDFILYKQNYINQALDKKKISIGRKWGVYCE